jgi:hypothetical protein
MTSKDRFPNHETICGQCGTTIYKPFKELSDDEIADLIEAVNEETGRCNVRIFDHTKVLLRKLKEKYEREPKENN